MVDKIESQFGKLTEGEYTSKINTPSKYPLYFDRFHKPLVDRALERNRGQPISLVGIACGYGHELDFLKDRRDVNLWGIDISDTVLIEARKRLPNAQLLNHDVRNGQLPYKSESMDAAIAVNAVVYSPEDMLRTMHQSLKPNREAVVNFRNFNNEYNHPFYEHYLSDGATITDQELRIGKESFILKVLDYRTCRDEKMRSLDRQVYFQSTDDIERFIKTVEFEIVAHDTFHFKSPVNPNNEMDVYTIRKPIGKKQ